MSSKLSWDKMERVKWWSVDLHLACKEKHQLNMLSSSSEFITGWSIQEDDKSIHMCLFLTSVHQWYFKLKQMNPWTLGDLGDVLPSLKLTVRTWKKVGPQKERIFFEASIFRMYVGGHVFFFLGG